MRFYGSDLTQAAPNSSSKQAIKVHIPVDRIFNEFKDLRVRNAKNTEKSRE